MLAVEGSPFQSKLGPHFDKIRSPSHVASVISEVQWMLAVRGPHLVPISLKIGSPSHVASVVLSPDFGGAVDVGSRGSPCSGCQGGLG